MPLTTEEYDEWGDPRELASYQQMRRYSPRDNIKAHAYRHLFVTSGLHDSQVQYWEPAKWVAKLREYKRDNHQLLLKTDLDAGHGGKSGRLESCAEIAWQYAFLIGLANGQFGET